MEIIYNHVGPVLAQRDSLTVIDCRACGWAHLDPLPTVPAGYYEAEFWQHDKAGWLEKYEAERDWLDMRHADWINVLSEHTDARNIVDIGCGYGFFISYANANGWKAIGVDASKEACNYASAHGLIVACDTFEHVHYPQVMSNISAFWLMEHLPAPFAFLAWCRSHLAPGGVLMLAVPQEFTTLQAHANERVLHDWFVHPTHLNYWTAATLYGLLGRAGFRVVDALATYPIERYLVGDLNYVGDEELGDQIHAAIRKRELVQTHEHRLTQGREWARRAIGRDLIVFAKVDV